MNIAQVFPGGPALLCKTGNNKRYKVTGQEKVEGNPVTGSKVCHGDDGMLHKIHSTGLRADNLLQIVSIPRDPLIASV